MRRVLWGIGIWLVGGCTSLSSLQTARIVPEGEYRFTAAGGAFATSALSSTDTRRLNYPFVEAAARFGFTPGWDLGIKYTAPGMLTGDVKFSVFENRNWAVALGFGVGYLALEAPAGSTQFTGQVLDLIVPLYVSYEFSAAFGLYVAPKYVARSSQQNQSLVGGAVGVRLGNSWGVMLEVGGAADLKSDYDQLQVSGGFFLGPPHWSEGQGD